ncbi:unnamed protein product [Cladocopium goreaui]|uniref:Acyl-protein thioesterase 1 (Palmitoyl-protei n hydrolase) n=1 Tax=Cladocopium goreaui TaxID=2562237 RepID=A0A9P1CM47_9DINO|nr:unnamed protein product [Cladocopium goreaui]
MAGSDWDLQVPLLASPPMSITTRRPLVLAPKVDCEGAVLWLHGFDDNSAGWSQLLPRRLSWCWVHLRAPKVAQSFFGGRKMAAWGDFLSAARIEVGSEDHECSDERGIYATCSRLVQQELDRVQQKYRLDSTRVILAGYSQGAACALQSVAEYPKPLAGCIAISGWLLPAARIPAATRSFWLFHGREDVQVSVNCSSFAAEKLRSLAADTGIHNWERQ